MPLSFVCPSTKYHVPLLICVYMRVFAVKMIKVNNKKRRRKEMKLLWVFLQTSKKKGEKNETSLKFYKLIKMITKYE